MSRAGEFEGLRPVLFSIAYRILGSVTEAEDAVQDTWLRYDASPVQAASAKAYLSAVITQRGVYPACVWRPCEAEADADAGPAAPLHP